MNLETASTKYKGRRVGLVRLRQQAELRKRYVAQIPRWRHPIVGYFASIPVVGLALLVMLLAKQMLLDFYFSGSTMFLGVVIIALFWGVGPALFSVLLSAIALDYLYIPPPGISTIFSWRELLQLAPFLISGIIIAAITGQREAARLRALFAEQEAQAQAQELAQTNLELEQANQLKDQFLSMASHELKTPITSISGQAQVMLRRISKKQELPEEFVDIRTALERINEQTRRLNTLVDDLLSLSSIRSGKLNLRISACNLGEICRSVVEEQRSISGRTIDIVLPASPVIIQADSDRISQVVTNLVSNALKYSSPESPVRVAVSAEKKVALLKVHDSGQGISQEELAHIFDTFYRAQDAHTSKQSGWGLGLAICKDIVERHGGRIWCESKVNDGSTFFVELPLE
ncbi:MAG: ATP-binding protein [Ktedonobacteraceae bacterium]